MSHHRVTDWVPLIGGIIAMICGLMGTRAAAVDLMVAQTPGEFAYYGLWLIVFGPMIAFLGYVTVTLGVERRDQP